jgi:hypothetical protein
MREVFDMPLNKQKDCDYRSNEYCVYELSCWMNDDHYGNKHRFPDADLVHCENPCPYDETSQREPTETALQLSLQGV